jgi:hypothetical protein
LIPRIGVDALIETVGLDVHANVAAPARPQDVGWYRFGPPPGAPGSALLDGHLDWSDGPAVFWKLHLLRPGDELEVAPAGAPRLRFRVVSSATYSAGSAPPARIFATSGPSRLALITCAGEWDEAREIYLDRLVVEATLISS